MKKTARANRQEKTGARLRSLRESKGIMAKFVAARMKISATYLSDLEHDRRGWSARLIAQFEQVVGAP